MKIITTPWVLAALLSLVRPSALAGEQPSDWQIKQDCEAKFGPDWIPVSN